MAKYNNLKNENDNFQKEINRTLKFDKYISKKKNPYNGENSKRDLAFSEIISNYKARGIKVPDLSIEKNLFKPSALLIDQAGLKNYFQIKKGEKNHKGFDEKETYFISKVNNLTFKRLQELDSRADSLKINKQKSRDSQNLAMNIYQTKMLNIDNSNTMTMKDNNIEEEVNIKQLRKNIDLLISQNENIKDNINKFQDNNNNDFLNESDDAIKNKRLNSPKKNKKPKIAYQDFIKRLAKPKDKDKIGLSLIEIKKDPESKILNVIENIMGEKNPYKPILKSSDGKILKNVDVYSQYLNTVREKMRKSYNNNNTNGKLGKTNGNGFFPNIFGSTKSSNFENINFNMNNINNNILKRVNFIYKFLYVKFFYFIFLNFFFLFVSLLCN